MRTTMYLVAAIVVAASIAATLPGVQPVAVAAGRSCSTLAALSLPQTRIIAATEATAGAFTRGGSAPDARTAAIYKALPPFCRVQGVIQPSGDSHIKFEVWLPLTGWNGRYLGVGNGGFAGSINYLARPDSNAPSLAQALAGGYATSSTDTGHEAAGTDSDWAIGHPEKVVDYGYRAIHETAVASKTIVAAFYGNNPAKSYFNSCSNGGRQAMMEAQRFPSDYDGIVAGDPSYFSTHLGMNHIWNAQALMATPASYIPDAKLPAIQAAALEACDASDGLKDGLISEPTTCRFNPATLLCKGADSDSCLTQPQVDALKKIYAGPRTSKGEQVFPGLLPGDEAGTRGWNYWVTGTKPGTSAQYLLGVVGTAKVNLDNPSWDFKTFNFDTDVAVLDAKAAKTRNATDPDLTPFADRGGKLLLYHGWSDAAIAPLASVNYVQSVVSKMGAKKAEDVVQLYMVPGMQHCGGGPGPDVISAVSGPLADARHSVQVAIEQWVEKGARPGPIVATKYKAAGTPAEGVARTRPICPYPQAATYKGAGSIDDAANFVCTLK